jgi:hypothetical protein
VATLAKGAEYVAATGVETLTKGAEETADVLRTTALKPLCESAV